MFIGILGIFYDVAWTSVKLIITWLIKGIYENHFIWYHSFIPRIWLIRMMRWRLPNPPFSRFDIWCIVGRSKMRNFTSRISNRWRRESSFISHCCTHWLASRIAEKLKLKKNLIRLLFTIEKHPQARFLIKKTLFFHRFTLKQQTVIW